VHTKSGRQDRQAQITTFLKKNVGFTQDQLGRYDTISSENRSKMKVVFDEIAVGREDIFRKLASQEYSDSAIVIAANAIAEQQKAFEIKMLFHLKDIRNICTPVQQAVFDTGFYKIISKRSDGRNNKKNK
jgi:Spy/CpxP family protein refolding chaperone